MVFPINMLFTALLFGLSGNSVLAGNFEFELNDLVGPSPPGLVSPRSSTSEQIFSDDETESKVPYGVDPLLPRVRLETIWRISTDGSHKVNELRPTWYRGSRELMSFPFTNWAAGRADMRAYVFLKLLESVTKKGTFLAGKALLADLYQEVMGVISSPRKVMEWNGAHMDFDERQHADVFWPTASGTVLMAQLAEQYGLTMSNGGRAASVMEVGVGSGWACTFGGWDMRADKENGPCCQDSSYFTRV